MVVCIYAYMWVVIPMYRASNVEIKFFLRGVVHPMFEELGAWYFRFVAMEKTDHSVSRSLQDLFRFKMLQV